jgi:acyl-CoA-binding protein
VQEEDEVDEERPLTEEEIAEMIAEYERVKDYEARKWRYVKRPGGQAVRPPIWYELYGASQYLNQGENKEPAPVWREDGSIDYGGREKWDAWTKCSGMSEQEAKIAFVRAMRRAESNAKDNFY